MLEGCVAVSEIGDAIDHASRFLWPFNRGVWLRLALISFFVGGSSFFPGQYQWFFQNDLPTGVIATAFIAITTAYVLLFAVFQFVFVESIRSGTVAIRPYFRRWFSKGTRLFIFHFGLQILTMAIIALLVAIFFLPLLISGEVRWNTAIESLVVPIFFIVIIAGIIALLTIDFVVPIMVKEDMGVLDGWRRFGGILHREWREVAVYTMLKLILVIGVAILLIILTLISLFIIALPFVGIGLLLSALTGAPGYTLLPILLIPFLLIAIPVALLIRVPFEAFLRYYSLLVIGRIAPEYALVPVVVQETP